jgi:hypothetical protein
MAAIGSSPFEFTDGNGKQVSIPLAALTFTAGVLDVDVDWPPLKRGEYGGSQQDSLTTQQAITNFLAELTKNRIFTEPPPVAPQPALLVTAADPGIAGNNITVAITKDPDLDPAKAKFDITVVETEVYTGLSAGTIEAVLGTETTPGSKPGLAHVLSGSVDKTLTPVDQTVTFPAGTPGVNATIDINDATPALVFTLEARKPGPGSAFAKAEISDAAGGTFTLTLTWERTLTGAKLLTDLAPLSDEITATAPAGGTFSIPATTAAPVALSGGTATASASAVLSGD